MFFPEEMRAITKTITAQKGVYGSPDKLISASPYEVVEQDRNVLLALYRVPEGERFQHMNLYWPDCLERSQEGGWYFGRDGDFFLALFCTEEGEWSKQEHYSRFRCPAEAVGFVVVTRPIDETGAGPTFEVFREGILGEERPHFRGTSSPQVLTWRQQSVGTPHPAPPVDAVFPVFEGPFLSSPASGVIRMTDGETVRMLDFNTMTIEESR
jgi:hypothetical protein